MSKVLDIVDNKDSFVSLDLREQMKKYQKGTGGSIGKILTDQEFQNQISVSSSQHSLKVQSNGVTSKKGKQITNLSLKNKTVKTNIN
jgi:hypothetical protein